MIETFKDRNTGEVFPNQTEKPNGACTEKLMALPSQLTTNPCTQAVEKDMSIINQRPILHRDRHIAIRFTQAMSTQTVAR